MKGKVEENKEDPKRFWRVINNEILGKKQREGVKAIKNDVGQLLYGKEAADYMNCYYANMGKAKKEADNSTIWDSASMNRDIPESRFTFSFVESVEVEKLVRDINVSKASGIEGISAKVLKDCLLICKIELTFLFNMSLHTGIFPMGWKDSVITPIPKEGHKLCAGNWRPINNICVPGKLLEKCVHVQLMDYIESNN